MSEVIFKPDSLNNEVVSDGKSIYFAHGEETSSFAAILIFVALLGFAFLLTFFEYFFKKIEFLSADHQFYLACILSLLICIGLPIIIYKRLTASVKVSAPERQNVIVIDTATKQVTLKEKNKIVGTFTLSKDDYFWAPKAFQSKNLTTYRLVFVHNNNQYAVVASAAIGDIIDLKRRLVELSLPLQEEK